MICLWAGIEPVRLYYGFSGNLKERVRFSCTLSRNRQVCPHWFIAWFHMICINDIKLLSKINDWWTNHFHNSWLPPVNISKGRYLILKLISHLWHICRFLNWPLICWSVSFRSCRSYCTWLMYNRLDFLSIPYWELSCWYFWWVI